MTGTLDLYVTNSETLYPSENEYGEVVVRLYGRTPDREARRVTVRGFEPYFYTRAAERDEVRPADHSALERYEATETTPLEDRFAHLDPWREPEDLVKVVADKPGNVRGLRKQFEKTWGADVIFTERFRIDNDITTGVRVPDGGGDSGTITVSANEIEPIELTDVPPRVVTLDIETDDRETGFPDPGEARVLSVVAHDNYTDEYVGFLDLDGRSLEDHFDLGPVQRAKAENGDLGLDDLGIEHLDGLKFEKSERRTLIGFGCWLQERDPDLVCGWNSGDESTDGFDLAHLIARMRRVGADPGRLSREDDVEVTDYGEIHLKGRNCYDLMDGWADTKFTQPRSMRLDWVAGEVLDDAKIQHPDKGYYEMYREDPAKFLSYNAKDTKLTVQINDAENILGFKKRLKDMIGVDWDRTHENNEFIEMSIRRKCREHGIVMVTKYDNEWVQREKESDDDGVNYEGAWVFEAFSGVKENVTGIDLASLYPMTQWMLNASPDARIDRKMAFKHDIPHVVAENGQCFRIDRDGIIRELVDEYHQVKREFKQERQAADYGTPEWEEAAEAYNVTKTIYNSYYGYSGWARSPLYNPHDAAAVTLTGQRVIKRTAEYVAENTEGEIVYGDTDSTYMEWPSEWSQEETLARVEEVCTRLNTDVYPEFCDEFMIPREDNRWEIEPEMRAERFFMSGSKKMYAYLKMWDEGDDHDTYINDGDGKFSVTGYPCVKSNFSLLTKQVQEDVLEMIVRDADRSAVADRLFEAAASIDPRDPDWERIGIPQGIGQHIDREKAGQDDYYAWSSTGDHPRGEAPRAAYFANCLLDVEFTKGDKPKRAKLKPGLTVDGDEVDVIAYETERDLEPVKDKLRLDPAEAERKTLKNPMEDILEAYGLEPGAALQGKTQEQTGIGRFA